MGLFDIFKRHHYYEGSMRVLIGFLVSIFCVSCASISPSGGIMFFGQTGKDTRKTINGTMTYETFVVIPIGASLLSDDDKMGLKIGRIYLDENLVRFYFRAEVHAHDWIFAKGIAVKVDDKIYRLYDSDPNRQVINGDYVVEILSFNVAPDMVEAIKNATTFEAELYRRVVKVEGEKLQKFKEFLQ
ncbi:MAG: hypothetical protein LBB61_07885 [Treponema sp.]|jgi:hypothetical protein|nr:hypothetical protein [Treponema sp.]